MIGTQFLEPPLPTSLPTNLTAEQQAQMRRSISAAYAGYVALDTINGMISSTVVSPVYTLNAGRVAATSNGCLTLASGAGANARPSVILDQNITRYYELSGSANVVVPITVSSFGVAVHRPGTINQDGKIRFGIGMPTGSSTPAGDANALTGIGIGWEIYSDGEISKIRLMAHNGTSYLTSNGIATGLGANHLNTFFLVAMSLGADGLLTARVHIGTLGGNIELPSAPSLSLSTGITMGVSYANGGVLAAATPNHSTTAATAENLLSIYNRKILFI